MTPISRCSCATILQAAGVQTLDSEVVTVEVGEGARVELFTTSRRLFRKADATGSYSVGRLRAHTSR